MKQLTIGKNSALQRADKFLMKAFPSLPSALMYKAFRKKDVKVNGKWIKESFILNEGDIISIYLPDDALSPKRFVPVSGDLDVVYEDENIIIIDKPAGVACQDGSPSGPPLCDILKTYLYNRKEYVPENEQSFAPALCNRIDTNTAGLVIGAKNAAALRVMNEAIRLRQVKKFYLCEVEGRPPKDEDEVEIFLSKDASLNKSFVSDKGMQTLTHYKVLKYTNQSSICLVELKSGRSHQIRAVMSALGCPLKGDRKYGASSGGGQALISYRLSFEVKNPMFSYLNGKLFYSKHSIAY